MPSDPQTLGASATGWQAVRETVLARIRAGEWAPGALIPNEAVLAREFGCARATVNRALRELAATGLIDRRRKAGTRVALQPLRRVTLEIPVIRTEIEARGGQYGYALLAREEGPAPLAVWSRMGLGAEAELLHLRALHLSDGRPYLYEDRWVNPATVPGLLEVDLTETSANLWLVRNVPYTSGDLSLQAVPAEAEVAEALACARGAAIFVMERLTWLGAASVTLVTQHYAPGYRLITSL